MKLIKMTDFVENLRDEMIECSPLNSEKTKEYFDKVFFYNNFLKMNLNLGMFIPCDENFNILKKPNHYRRFISKEYLNENPKMSEKWVEKCEEYKKSERKILFKDFQFFIEEGGEKCVAIEGFVLPIEVLFGMKVEDISDNGIELTNYAIKRIFD